MGKNKNKKIHKEKNKNKQESFRKVSQNNAQQQVAQNQQFQCEEGIFQQFAKENADIMQNEGFNSNNSKEISLNKCLLGSGWIYILNINKCYHIINKNTAKADIVIIDGSANINGKKYYELFGCKAESDLVIEAFKNPNKAQDKNNKIEEKNTKESKNKEKKAKRAQKEENIKYYNKNTEQIVHKILTNKYLIMEEASSQQQLKQLITQDIAHYLADYENQQNILLWTNCENVEICVGQKNKKPWDNIDPLKYIGKGETTLLVGPKNTGKSMFCQYLENQAASRNIDICILDFDIGRNRTYPGCISLSFRGKDNKKQDISIWIGEYTPLNCIPTYIKAIHKIYQYYHEKYFTSSLIINTMGYLTGLGELMLYQIFNIVKPQRVLFMQSISPQHFLISNIQNNLKNGRYIERLYFKNGENCTKTSTKIQKYTNHFADQKSAPQRFQSLVSNSILKSIEDLIFLILAGKMRKIQDISNVYYMNKYGNICKIEQNIEVYTNMRLIILGQNWREGLLEVKGVGFGWKNDIFYDSLLVNQSQIKVALVVEGIDFERSFYQINQSRIIQIEAILGQKIPYICPLFKGLGNKGMRNNPAKKAAGNKN